ncbi:MAG: fibronectin type III-like domain-contianing protein, partial [Faecousia sp.]
YRLEDNPSYLNFPGDGFNVDYAEGIYVGYRYYEAKKLPVRWAFGHGLSYTTFAYSNLRLSAPSMDDGTTVTVSVDVTNTGKVAGKEVVQLYVADRNGTPGRCVKELKGFRKLSLQPGETKTASMVIDGRALSFYHEGLGDWYAPSGTYEVLIGHASDDIKLTATLSFTTAKRLPLVVTGATTLGELMRDSRTAAVVGQMLAGMGKTLGADQSADESNLLGSDPEMMKAMLTGMPLKSLASFSGGALDLDSLIAKLNQLADA